MRLEVVYNNETLNLLLREPQGERGWSSREGKSRMGNLGGGFNWRVREEG